MALIQRYTTELSTHYQIQDDKQSVEHILNNITTIKQQDKDEKYYLHSLNDRLEELVHSLNQLEIENQKLRDDLNLLIINWGINGENHVQFLKELDYIINQLTEQNHRRCIFQGETKIFDVQTQIIDRISIVFIDIINLYRDKSQIIFDLTKDLEDELHKIDLRLNISNSQILSHDNDYKKELENFRLYLNEWSQLTLDKQYLLNEIQSLKERYNLRLAYNQEEIKEWQRLLNRISYESKNFYRDYLDTIKQQVQIDYEQMSKDQQMNIEIQLKTRLKEIQHKIDLGLPIDENDERKRREEKQQFENRLDQSTKDYDRLQNDYRILAEEIQHKKRTLSDLENELKTKKRKHKQQHGQLEYNTDLIRTDYYILKDELDKLAYQLRFSVEEELKIYETLLNSFQRKKEDNSKYHHQTTKHYIDTISSGGESTGFRHSQPNLLETTKISISKKGFDDATKYRPPPPPSSLLTETIKQQNNTIPIIHIDQVDIPNNHWTYESGTTSSTHDESTDRDRYDSGIQQSLLDQNRTTTTTTRTTRRFGHGNNTGQQQTAITSNIPEMDEKFLESKIHITRKYKGNILIKFVDVSGRFVEIENTGNQSRDLTGWYIERTVDGHRINFIFPIYELAPHKTVRIYGNYYQRSSSPSITNDQNLQLIASNFSDWGNGRQMRTELFNRDDIGKALFEQTIRD